MLSYSPVLTMSILHTDSTDPVTARAEAGNLYRHQKINVVLFLKKKNTFTTNSSKTLQLNCNLL